MALIDIGAAASNRASSAAALYTSFDRTNPANASGKITQVQVYVNSAVTGLRVGTFYLVSGTTYRCRDSVTLGSAGVGLQTFDGLSINVVTGDFIGFYHATGTIDRADTGGDSGGISGEYIDPGDQASYSIGARLYSLYGTGKTLGGPKSNPSLILVGRGGL